ncbi:MAG: UvrD-helicase domain-containing protein [Planctomycetes bacterium]|nr:UvrD-helicase domain-containing protein [Planctomycetota bacterium]
MDTARLLEDLNSAQRDAVGHVEGPLLVLAGAGSGKTRVVTRRIAYLLAQGVRPSNILALTFTNKAAAEMRKRVEALTALRGLWVSTFHSTAARLLRQHIQHLGRDPQFTIFDTDDRLKLIKQACDQLKLPSSQWKPSSFAAPISQAKNRLVSPAEFARANSDYFGKTAARVYDTYEKLLMQNNGLDFDDLLLKLTELLASHEEVRHALQQRFQFILIDEYQDTNRAQYLIARMLSDTHHNLHVTGDPDQSIYSWRGADIQNILDFEKDFPEAKVVKLEQNYRSTQNILAAASSVIRNNHQRRHKDLWTENEKGDMAVRFEAIDETDEARQIVRAVRSLQSGGRPLSDLAVFYRTNAQSRVLEDALRNANLAYVIVGGLAFYERREVKDIMAYVRAVVNPKDEVSLERILNVPARGIGDAAARALRAHSASAGCGLLESVRRAPDVPGISSRALKGLERFLGLYDALASLPPRPVADFVRRIIDATGYVQDLQRGGDESADDRIENVWELVSAAESYDQENPDRDIRSFSEESVLATDLDRWDESRDAVTLMTLHLAKGLEFPVVFIAGLEEGLLPHYNSMETEAGIEEERRLFFVGMTRARQRLFLSHAEVRHQFGTVRTNPPSPFLDEIPEKLAQRADSEMEEHPEGDEPAEELEIGDLVRHHRFGLGTVINMEHGRAELTLEVRFQRFGVKKLDAALARLARVR